MSKFKVGDKVKIKRGLKGDVRYTRESKCGSSTLYFSDKMEKYNGKIATITGVDEGRFTIDYKIDLDNGSWSWSSGMFEEEMNKFQVGDKARVRKDLEHDLYDRLRFHPGMDYLKGQIITIDKIDEDGDYYNNTHNYYFNDEMLEEVKGKQEKIGESEVTLKMTGAFNKIYDGVKKDVNNTFKRSYLWYRNGNVITCIIKSAIFKGVGIAKCNSADKFDYDKGCILAEARANADFYNNRAKEFARR